MLNCHSKDPSLVRDIFWNFWQKISLSNRSVGTKQEMAKSILAKQKLSTHFTKYVPFLYVISLEKRRNLARITFDSLCRIRDDQGRCFQASELEQEFKWRRQKTRSFQNVACSLMKANCSLTLTRSHLFVLRNLSRVKLGVFLSTVSHRFTRSASEAYLELTSNRPASSLDGLFQNLVKQNRPIMTHKWKARNDLSLRSNGISGKVTVWRERERGRSEQ